MGRYKDVIQSWLVGCDGRHGSFPTMHVLWRLCSRSPNDLLTTWHDFLTLYPRLLFIPDHSRSFWTVQNNREQSGTPRPSSPTSQDLPRPIPVLSRLSYDFPRPLPTIKVGKGRLSGRLSVTGALQRIPILSASKPTSETRVNCKQLLLLAFFQALHFISTIHIRTNTTNMYTRTCSFTNQICDHRNLE